MAIWLVWFPVNVICKNLHTYIRSYAEVFQMPMYSMLSFISACLHCLPHRSWKHLLPLSKATSRSWKRVATGTWTRSNQSECSLHDPQCGVVEAHGCVEISLDGQYTTVDKYSIAAGFDPKVNYLHSVLQSCLLNSWEELCIKMSCF